MQVSIIISMVKNLWNQCCGYGMFIPDPGSEFFSSRILDAGSVSKNLSILTQKIAFKLSEIWYGSVFIPDPDNTLIFYPSRSPDPGIKMAPDPWSGSATLAETVRKKKKKIICFLFKKRNLRVRTWAQVPRWRTRGRLTYDGWARTEGCRADSRGPRRRTGAGNPLQHRYCIKSSHKCSVADPDSGFGAFLTPWSRIRDPGWVKSQDPEQPGSYFLEFRNHFLGF